MTPIRPVPSLQAKKNTTNRCTQSTFTYCIQKNSIQHRTICSSHYCDWQTQQKPNSLGKSPITRSSAWLLQINSVYTMCTVRQLLLRRVHIYIAFSILVHIHESKWAVSIRLPLFFRFLFFYNFETEVRFCVFAHIDQPQPSIHPYAFLSLHFTDKLYRT